MIFVGDFIPQKTQPCVPDFGDQWIVANLEGPVCEDGLKKSVKTGIHLHSRAFDVQGKWAFALANNHLMDYGYEGLKQTREFLSSKRWPCAGAGVNREDARQQMVLEECGKRIAVFSCCEHQFGIATDSDPGVAGMGLWLIPAVRKAKVEGADFVVVSCHCASEFSTMVSPSLQEFYHALVDVGADVIHGHHSHVPQGWEEYKGRPIFYGLGNFVVDPKDWNSNPHFQWSLIARVDFSGSTIKWEVTPHGQLPDNVSDYISRANLGFRDPTKMLSLWQGECVRLYHKIYEQNLRAASVESVRMSVRARARKIVFALSDCLRALIGRELPTARSRYYARNLGNYFRCESHRDVISTALEVLTDKDTNPQVRLICERDLGK